MKMLHHVLTNSVTSTSPTPYMQLKGSRHSPQAKGGIPVVGSHAATLQVPFTHPSVRQSSPLTNTMENYNSQWAKSFSTRMRHAERASRWKPHRFCPPIRRNNTALHMGGPLTLKRNSRKIPPGDISCELGASRFRPSTRGNACHFENLAPTLEN